LLECSAVLADKRETSALSVIRTPYSADRTLLELIPTKDSESISDPAGGEEIQGLPRSCGEPMWALRLHTNFKTCPVKRSVSTELGSLLIALLVKTDPDRRLRGPKVQGACGTTDPVALLINGDRVVLGELDQMGRQGIETTLLDPVSTGIGASDAIGQPA
jgi:hypothetical protein